MKRQKDFFKTVCKIAVPVTFQSILQASFGVIDQIMIGQLGSASVAGVGLAGKFTSIYSVLISAIATVAGIMIAQYVGQKNKKEVTRSLLVNSFTAVAVAILFTAVSLIFPSQVMSLYTKDEVTLSEAVKYLIITAAAYIPLAGSNLISVMFRCIEKASLPLYAGIASALLNTVLNYTLIFGKFGAPHMGVVGAAAATVAAQTANFLIMLVMFIVFVKRGMLELERGGGKFNLKQYIWMLIPMVFCEFMWSLGENVYAAIYGRMGTDACAAMTLINPVQSLMIGALCGLSQAASVIIGKLLGEKSLDEAYLSSKKLIAYGTCGSLLLSLVLLFIKPYYVDIYNVEESVKALTEMILVAYAIVAPFKVLNMILGGGILRSGGNIKLVMWIDLLGTWGLGVPLGLLTAFVFKLPIPYVYFILSLEECVRFAVSLCVFKKKHWMNQLES